MAGHPLRPDDPWAAAQMRLWTKQLDEGVHFATGVVSFCIAFREQFLAKRPEEIEAFLAGLQSQERRDRLKVSLREGMDASFFPPAVKRMTKLLDDMEAALQHSDWIAGSGYSLADIAMTPICGAARSPRLRFPNRGAAQDRRLAGAESRPVPSFDEAMARWYEPSYLELFDRVRPNARARLKSLIHRA